MIKLTNILFEMLDEKKADRCKRIADRRYSKPSAYKSGAIVRCRQGKIWKNIKENELNELGPNDIHYQNILNYYDKSNDNVKKKILEKFNIKIIKNKSISEYAEEYKKKLEKELSEIGRDVLEIEQELGISLN